MTKKKDLYNLHCRVEHLTAEKLKAWSEELGYSMGEVIDCVVDGYEYLFRTIPVQHSGDTRSLFCE